MFHLTEDPFSIKARASGPVQFAIMARTNFFYVLHGSVQVGMPNVAIWLYFTEHASESLCHPLDTPLVVSNA